MIITSMFSSSAAEELSAHFRNDPTWKESPAVKNNMVFFLQGQGENIFNRQSVRTAEAAQLMAQMLHPEAFDAEVPLYDPTGATVNVIGNDYAKHLALADGVGDASGMHDGCTLASWPRSETEPGGGDLNDTMVGRAKAKLLMVLTIGLFSIFFLLVVSWSLGAVDIPFTSTLGHLKNIILNLGPDMSVAHERIIWDRMVRSVAVMGVGIGLSVSGVVMQALIRNPLVDPYVTGISSGAALGATLSILAGVAIVPLAEFATPIAAFIGATVAFFITMSLAEATGGRSMNYVLSGVIVGIAISSFTTILIVFSRDQRLHNALFWLYGSFSYISWVEALLIIASHSAVADPPDVRGS